MNAEDWTIATITARVPHGPSPAGPGDDAAVVGGDGAARVVTTDLLVEGIHFLRQHPPAALGWKALAVNLSDVAAMGATPEGFTLGLALPRRWEAGERARWVEAFAGGLGEAARAAGVVIAGGDTVGSSGGLTIAITAWGRVAGNRVLTRDGARAGDGVWVTGPIGRASEGLRRWLASAEGAGREAEFLTREEIEGDPLLMAQLRPEPPLAAGPAALAAGATAGLDLSDGLARDLPRLAAASGVILAVDLAHLPPDPALAHLSPAARAAGGEDYGLLVTGPASCAEALRGLGFTRIGEALACPPGAPSAVRWAAGGLPIAAPIPDWEHF